MQVTRDVIVDLWPVYESGEASADTRQLVERFLAGDPELERVLRRADAAARRALGAPVAPASRVPDADPSVAVLNRVRRQGFRQKWLTGVAIALTLWPFAFSFNSSGLHRLPLDSERTALILLVAAVCWFFVWRGSRDPLK